MGKMRVNNLCCDRQNGIKKCPNEELKHNTQSMKAKVSKKIVVTTCIAENL